MTLWTPAKVRGLWWLATRFGWIAGIYGIWYGIVEGDSSSVVLGVVILLPYALIVAGLSISYMRRGQPDVSYSHLPRSRAGLEGAGGPMKAAGPGTVATHRARPDDAGGRRPDGIGRVEPAVGSGLPAKQVRRRSCLSAAPLALVILLCAGYSYLKPRVMVAECRVTSIVEGAPVTAEAVFVNEGRIGGERSFVLRVDGEAVGTRSASVGAGKREHTTFGVPGRLKAGTHTLDLRAETIPASFASARFSVLRPADLHAERIRLLPGDVVDAGTPVRAYLVVHNAGDMEGRREFTLRVDGRSVATTEAATLSGEDHATVRFDLPPYAPGEHMLEVDAQKAPLRITRIGRPANGSVMVDRIQGGTGQLEIKNQGKNDCVVALTTKGRRGATRLAVYVRAGKSYLSRGIKDGTYHVYVREGLKWDTFCREFVEPKRSWRFSESFVFHTTYDARRYAHTVLTVSFGREVLTIGGHRLVLPGPEEVAPDAAESVDVNEGEFPKY